MGQRLNLEICINGEPLANVYYHWSGYTQAALQLTDDFIANMTNPQTDLGGRSLVANALTALRNGGACLSETEAKALIEKFPDLAGEPAAWPTPEKDLDRNKGLIAFSEDGMDETRSCAEATVTIDIDAKLVNFDVLWSYDDIDLDAMINPPVDENVLDTGDIRVDAALPYETFHRLAVMGLRRPVPFYWRESDGTLWACIE